MQTSEVLNTAADHIEMHGHRKHGLGDVGKPTCAIGALMVATTGSTSYSNDWYPAGSRLQEYLGGGDEARISIWNNAPERTAAEVIEVLRACAVIEQSRERQPVEVAQ